MMLVLAAFGLMLMAFALYLAQGSRLRRPICKLAALQLPPSRPIYGLSQPQRRRSMTEIEMPMEMTTHLLKNTVETLIDLDEPEALLSTLRDAAARQRGKRWHVLAHVLGEAEVKLDQMLNAKPAGPDFTKPEPEAVNTDGEAKSA